jgi:uncharacterized protein
VAAENGDLDAGRLLLENKADVRVKDNRGRTAFLAATFNGRLHIAELLLKNGATINEKDTEGLTAFMLAVRQDNVRHFCPEILEMLLDKGADANSRDMTTNSPALMIAVLKGHEGIVRMLLDKGADVNAQDKNGDTALIAAAREGMSKTAKILLVRGADINVRNNLGKTAMDTAEEKGVSQIVSLLRAYDPGHIDLNTELVRAASLGDLTLVKKSLDKGADVNAEDITGHTALAIAAERGHLEVVNVLLEKGRGSR